MSITQQTLIQQTRRLLRDWKDFDSTTASLSNSVTTVNVADSSIYAARWPIEVDQELMMVRALPSGTTLTVERGAMGSTAASHASGAVVLIRPDFYSVEIADALNQGILACFPQIYKPVNDTSLSTADNTYEYTVPNMPGSYNGSTIPIPYVNRLEIKVPGDLTYRPMKRYEILRAATPLIKLRSPYAVGGTLRVSGFGPFPPLASITDTLDAQWPVAAQYLLPIYAASHLLQSGEAGRVRTTGPRDDREAANRAGSSMSAGLQLYNRFLRELASCAMPPLPKHVRPVI
jgi:hypothetical protein